MSDIGHNSDASPIKVAGYFLEWRRIEDAKDELAEQSKALFKSMKDEGFDTKAARVAFREKRDALDAKPEDITRAEDAEALTDVYRAALDRGLEARAHPARSARENIEQFPPHNPETGELVDEESGQPNEVHGEADHLGDGTVVAAANEPAASLSDEIAAPLSNSSEPLRSDAAETLPSSPEVSATNSALVAQRTEQGASTSSVAGSNPAECSTDEDFTPPAFLSRESKPLRPLCQNPDNCSGYGAKTCHECLKSAGVSYGASA